MHEVLIVHVLERLGSLSREVQHLAEWEAGRASRLQHP
jgi:hypothetical protein